MMWKDVVVDGCGVGGKGGEVGGNWLSTLEFRLTPFKDTSTEEGSAVP